MAGNTIEIGISKEHMYIGIMPPLTDAQVDKLKDAHKTDSEILTDFTMVTNESHVHYSEASMSRAEYPEQTEAAQHILRVAHRIGRILEDTEVNVCPLPVTATDHTLFRRVDR